MLEEGMDDGEGASGGMNIWSALSGGLELSDDDIIERWRAFFNTIARAAIEI
jgi:hypothetical protein